MLVIAAKDYNDTIVYAEWHIGEDVNALQVRGSGNLLNKLKVVAVQADGDELLHIERIFTGIPMAKTIPVVTWYGDDAKFIVGNLK